MGLFVCSSLNTLYSYFLNFALSLSKLKRKQQPHTHTHIRIKSQEMILHGKVIHVYAEVLHGMTWARIQDASNFHSGAFIKSMALCDNSNIDHSMYKEAQTCYTLLELIIKKKRANVKTSRNWSIDRLLWRANCEGIAGIQYTYNSHAHTNTHVHETNIRWKHRYKKHWFCPHWMGIYRW